MSETSASPVQDVVADYIASMLRQAPKFTARQLDRLGSLVRQPQVESSTAA